ncbi:uncharacterized protein CC84DRAFT_721556 [Paraphaeosphaeria sporulosa]|uniref:Uncharacterized protein n=1 Tax=Paraphaeosphaeria sporulosa TaxID=1460663 RepID=A0A177CCP1_9PLEO|nr:uncharacterized protein CC84DRAFT_721556 [Paraphaeosphaeria sporulosa]OAG05403.1 hypothetical protein CC84DRAFT_721556 [Paraphaeosphaeria sporulosa]
MPEREHLSVTVAEPKAWRHERQVPLGADCMKCQPESWKLMKDASRNTRKVISQGPIREPAHCAIPAMGCMIRWDLRPSRWRVPEECFWEPCMRVPKPCIKPSPPWRSRGGTTSGGGAAQTFHRESKYQKMTGWGEVVSLRTKKVCSRVDVGRSGADLMIDAMPEILLCASTSMRQRSDFAYITFLGSTIPLTQTYSRTVEVVLVVSRSISLPPIACCMHSETAFCVVSCFSRPSREGSKTNASVTRLLAHA